jgi:hypothetical protein
MQACPDSCGRGANRRRAIVAVVVAAGAHLAALVAASQGESRRAIASLSLESDAYVDSIEVALLRFEPGGPAPPEEPAARGENVLVRARESSGAGRPSAATTGTSVVSTKPEMEGEERTAAEPPSEGRGLPPITFSRSGPVAIGIAGAGPNPFATQGSSSKASGAPTDSSTAAAPDMQGRADRSLKGALRQHDIAVGLGPEGPVIDALRDATYASAAPLHGSATFEAIVENDGAVSDLRLVASAGGAGWDDARERAWRLLEKTRLMLRGNGGIELRIEVRSGMREGAKGAEAVGAILTFNWDAVGAKRRRVVEVRLASFTTR